MTTPPTDLPFAVTLTISVDGRVKERLTATKFDDLDCRIEMLTGIRWLDCREQYDALVADCRRRPNREQYTVVNSYEKWGDYQFEQVEVDVRMAPL